MMKLDTLVELLDQFSNVYPSSVSGARGWIRAKRELPKSDPEVYIEWDREHWRYHGEKDGWTFEHHFREVSDPTPDELAAEFADALSTPFHELMEKAKDRRDEERCPHCGQEHGEEVQEQENYLNALMEGQEEALCSEGFIIITARPEPDPTDATKVIWQPEIFSATLTEEADEVLNAQITHMAALLFQAEVTRRLRLVKGEDQ